MYSYSDDIDSTGSASSNCSESSTSEKSASVHSTEEPSDALLDLDYLTVLNTIQDTNGIRSVQDTHNHRNDTKRMQAFSSTIDDDDKPCVPVESYSVDGSSETVKIMRIFLVKPQIFW